MDCTTPFVIPTRNENNHREQEGCQHEDEIDIPMSPAVTFLHSSFDATLVETDKLLNVTSHVLWSKSWNEAPETSAPNKSYSSPSLREVITPLTMKKKVSKEKRSSSLSSEDSTVPTPGRLPPTGIKSHRLFPTPTPSSPYSSRRRKASPLRMRQTKSPRPSSMPEFHDPHYQFHTQATTPRRPLLWKGNEISSTNKQPSSPVDSSTPAYSTKTVTTVRKSPRMPQTAETAATSASDVTVDTENSQESPISSSTPFQFTSFPASLPRVLPRPPSSSRENLTSQLGNLENLAPLKSGLPYEASYFHSTENSITFKRSRPPGIRFSQESLGSNLSEPHGYPTEPNPSSKVHNGESAPAVASVFLPYSGFNYNKDDHDDDEDDLPVRLQIPRTRLDFNILSSPSPKESNVDGIAADRFLGDGTNDLCQAHPLWKTDSPRHFDDRNFASLCFENETKNNVVMGYGISNQPSSVKSSSMLEQPPSPAEVQFRSRLDAAQCSPILPTAYNDGNDKQHLNAHAFSPMEMHVGKGIESVEGPSYSSNCKSLLSTNLTCDKSNDSNGSSNHSGSTKQRLLRPIPDLSAFDTAEMVSSSSMSSASSPPHVISNAHCSRKESGVLSLRRTCPPTPTRALLPLPSRTTDDDDDSISHEPFHTRTNSLIATKVLATCPVQTLDYHSSLENSLDTYVTCGDCSISADGSKEQNQSRKSMSFSTDESSGQGEERMDETEDKKMSNVVDQLKPNLDHNVKPDSYHTPTNSAFEAHQLGNTQVSSAIPTFETSGSIVSFVNTFEILGELGSGTFGDVFKVRSNVDGHHYAVKRNRRQFRGKRDRDMAMSEVRTMQKLQGVGLVGTAKSPSVVCNPYILMFYQAWQEEGYFFCQMELCCRNTCGDLIKFLRQKEPPFSIYPSLANYCLFNSSPSEALRLVPDSTVWKICHDIVSGLSHIHGCGMVHLDIKPSNILFVLQGEHGARCKIGDFGISGEIGTAEDGQEGDTIYMPLELLSSNVKHPSADIFSLGLTLYELALYHDETSYLPVEGSRWHEIRGANHVPELPPSRHSDLMNLIRIAIRPDPVQRPSADQILREFSFVKEAGLNCDAFLRDFLLDSAKKENDERQVYMQRLEQTPRNTEQRELRTPTSGIPMVPYPCTPNI